MKKPATLRALVSGQIRTAVFEGFEHVVVPVVALLEGVIQASNADTPELVLAEEFSKAPQGWNGRPAVNDHPIMEGTRVSANMPHVLETQAFGRVFNTEVRGDRLLMEAWLDPRRAQKVGRGAERVIERIRAGEKVEVSVGVFVTNDETPGVWKDGKKYGAIWREITPDHLALLPEGTEGACSLDMGCGAPRAAAANAEGASSAVEKEKPMTLKERFAAALARFRPAQTAEEQSDIALRDALWSALNSVEPGFLGVDSVFLEAKMVVYAVAPEGDTVMKRRAFQLAADGAVTLDAKTEEVQAVTTFEPVGASAQPTITAASCGCSGKTQETPATEVTREASMDKKAVVAAIIAAHSNLFTAADAALLETFPEDRLNALKDAKQPEPVAVAAVEEKVLTPEEKQKAFYTEFPEVAEIVNESKAASAAKKTGLVDELKAAQKAYTEDELKAMSVPQLEKVATLVAASAPKRDFSALAPRAANVADENVIPVPTFEDQNKKIREARQAS